MIKISIPNCNLPEVKYVCHCLFKEFLGIEYNVEIHQFSDFVIHCPQGDITIKNHFFKTDNINQLYLAENIPESVHNDSLLIDGQEFPIISIYGKSKIEFSQKNCLLDTDIFSSTFFMLSRWEEYANKERDNHDRYSAKNSLAYKANFINRPIVNEYIEILWNLLIKFGYKKDRKKYTYKIVPTHDVDRPFYRYTFNDKINELKHPISKGALMDLIRIVYRMTFKKDPYDTFDILMDLSEKAKVKSHFFFIVGGTTKYDLRYDIRHKRILNLIKRIEKRGHAIGLHPSYNCYNNNELFSQEKQLLEKETNMPISTGRHHYLRFSVPDTWQIWENNNMQWDSTLSYSDSVGFRCGICYSFSVFDCTKRQQLKLKERPLLIMEKTLIEYEKLTEVQSITKAKKIKEQVKKYNGEFIFLWHNAAFVNNRGEIFYSNLLNELYG